MHLNICPTVFRIYCRTTN